MLGLIIRPVGVGQQCNRLPDGPRTKEPSIDLTNTKVRWPCNAQHQSVHSCSVFMYFHLDLCNDCYVCIFFIVCGLHTHTKLEVLVQHIHHTVFVFFLCVRLFLFFCTYLLTLPKLKHGHWQCTMHRTTISRTKVTSTSTSSSSSMFPPSNKIA